MTQVSNRTAAPSEHGRLTELYREWGYTAEISAADVLIIAEQGGQTVAIVRRVNESSITMLRGMYVAPLRRRQGIGAELLEAFVRALPDGDCFCIPFTHLAAFYSRAGFVPVEEPSAPPFLTERLARYRREGHDVLVMRRQRGSPSEP